LLVPAQEDEQKAGLHAAAASAHGPACLDVIALLKAWHETTVSPPLATMDLHFPGKTTLLIFKANFTHL
jgi:hypothetical protein